MPDVAEKPVQPKEGGKTEGRHEGVVDTVKKVEEEEKAQARGKRCAFSCLWDSGREDERGESNDTEGLVIDSGGLLWDEEPVAEKGEA